MGLAAGRANLGTGSKKVNEFLSRVWRAIIEFELIDANDRILIGLSGGKDSAEKRARLLKQLDLPEHLSANSMLKLINSFMDFDDYKREIQKLNEGVKI